MKKYKLLYFVSEDEYFLSHKFFQAKDAKKLMSDVMITCNFSRYESKISSEGFKTYNLKINRKTINPIKNLIYLIKLIKIIKSFKPHIIQSIALKPILLTNIASFFLNMKIRIICCVVGMGFLVINKSFFSKIIKNIYFFLLKLFTKENVTFIFQNIDDFNFFKKHKLINNTEKFIIRGSGINTDKYRKGKKRKIYDLIFHSRVLKDKEFMKLLRLLSFYKKNIFLKTLILGNPDTKNYSSISRNKLHSWIKSGLIIWKPKVENVLPYLQQSKIALLPSYREGLPKSLLEAASCELPIIATNVPGCKEICINEFNGFTVKSRDYIDLAKSIERLINDKKLLKRFGKNSRKLVEKYFKDKIIAKKFREVYIKISKINL